MSKVHKQIYMTKIEGGVTMTNFRHQCCKCHREFEYEYAWAQSYELLNELLGTLVCEECQEPTDGSIEIRKVMNTLIVSVYEQRN